MNLKKFFIVTLVGIFCFIPNVNAIDNNIIIESIKATDASDTVVKSAEYINVQFNDLNQFVEYEVILKNNTTDSVYLNNFEVNNLSEDFIQIMLDDNLKGMELKSHSTSTVNVMVNTLDIEGAGRNLNDEVTLKLVLEDSINSHKMENNRVGIILLIVTIGMLIFIISSKVGKRIKYLVICLVLIGTTSVMADDASIIEIQGKVVYESQNIMETSGTAVAVNTINYSNSKEVWSYYDKVKNIYIKSDNSVIKKYYKKFDLTSNDKKRVTGYLVENGDLKVPYDLYIISKGIIYANEDSTGLFSFPNVEKIVGLNNIEFEDTRIFKGMFMGDEVLSKVDFSNINLSSATDTSYMFYMNYNLDVDESSFDVSKVANTNNMFVKYLYDVVKDGAISDAMVDFSISPSTGKYIINSSVNDANPIYYYRGAVEDNNVLFGEYCWKIVRTTDTGGVKIIYNGVPSADNSCNNTGTASQIGTSSFNLKYNSPAYAGYMYGDVYTIKTKELTNQADVYIYGNDVKWDGSKYTLVDTKASSNWSIDRTTLATKYHYTCFDGDGECESVYYIHYFGNSAKAYYLTLIGGKDIEDAKNEMFTNKTDSRVKTKIDEWYKSNMTAYTSRLEDTVWCNDRTIIRGPLFSNDAGNVNTSIMGANARNNKTVNPSIVCSRIQDRFTVDKANGNGTLTYPVGMLTADEYVLAGSRFKNSSAYLYTGEYQWTMSPYEIEGNLSSHYVLYVGGNLSDRSVNLGAGVRPAISLKSGTDYISGDGTAARPYVINEQELIYAGK